jgi:hypothetical protein
MFPSTNTIDMLGPLDIITELSILRSQSLDFIGCICTKSLKAQHTSKVCAKLLAFLVSHFAAIPVVATKQLRLSGIECGLWLQLCANLLCRHLETIAAWLRRTFLVKTQLHRMSSFPPLPFARLLVIVRVGLLGLGPDIIPEHSDDRNS